MGVEVVIHCGDIGGAEVVDVLAHWPAHFVLGNVDDPASLDAAIRRAGQTCHARFGTLELEGRTIAFLHGDDAGRLRQTIAEGRWDLVCCGHTHVARSVVEGRTHVLNPGALYRTAQPSVAVVRLPSLAVAPVNL
jgi:putative phosphoesterase